MLEEKFPSAVEFAKTAHGEQRRKYTNEPYWVHCLNVAQLVAAVPNATPEMITAALLHDTLEDTDTTQIDLVNKFGHTVRYYVVYLTDPPPEFGNREKRKEYVCQRMTKAPPQVKTIKLADLIDNTYSIVEHDPKFAVVYLKEKEKLLNYLVGGDAGLYSHAQQLLQQAKEKLGIA